MINYDTKQAILPNDIYRFPLRINLLKKHSTSLIQTSGSHTVPSICILLMKSTTYEGLGHNR